MSKREFKRIYADDAKEDQRVGFGKYSSKSLYWVVKNDPDYFKSIKRLYYHKFNLFKQKKYDFLSQKHFKDEHLHRDKKQDIVQIFVVNKKKGIREAVTKSELRIQYEGISETLMNECFVEAQAVIRQEFEIERDMLVDIHMLRYEELFDKACNADLSRVPPAYVNVIKAENYLNAIDILVQKEKALGMHSKGFKTQIQHFMQQKRQREIQKINFDDLSLKDQCTLLALIESTKVSDVIQPVIPASESIVVQSTTTLKIEAPIREAKQTDIAAEKEKEQKQIQGSTLSDVQNKIKENLRKQVEEAMKARNAKK